MLSQDSIADALRQPAERSDCPKSRAASRRVGPDLASDQQMLADSDRGILTGQMCAIVHHVVAHAPAPSKPRSDAARVRDLASFGDRVDGATIGSALTVDTVLTGTGNGGRGGAVSVGREGLDGRVCGCH